MHYGFPSLEAHFWRVEGCPSAGRILLARQSVVFFAQLLDVRFGTEAAANEGEEHRPAQVFTENQSIQDFVTSVEALNLFVLGVCDGSPRRRENEHFLCIRARLCALRQLEEAIGNDSKLSRSVSR